MTFGDSESEPTFSLENENDNEKLKITPKTEIVSKIETEGGSVFKYELPNPAHLLVADFETIEGVQDFDFNFVSLVDSETSESEVKKIMDQSGGKFIICKEGEIRISLDSEVIKISGGESVYVESGVNNIELETGTSENGNLLVEVCVKREGSADESESKKTEELFDNGLSKIEFDGNLNLSDLDVGEEFIGKRTYFWDPSNNDWYGEHAHKEGRQLHVCAEGKLEYRIDPGHEVDLKNLSEEDNEFYRDEDGLLVITLEKGELFYLPEKVWYKVRKEGGPEESRLVVMSDTSYDREEKYADMSLEEWRKNKGS